ncbi:hypothetical protein AB0E64_32405 [Streptomyces caelestis]|uniref:Uncharacterized protein n=1 Tax=Streptomyces caelestis TaxID=36816 RepID=A0A7W9HDL8_9ACTN|nr:hypothetical protein [Streptomyces caelestis]MBB5800034.1 hypothetical protein [Streptomyces caelestis]
MRRRWAAAVGLVACLLLLHLVVPGLAQGGHTAEAAVTAAAHAVDAVAPGAASGAEPHGAGVEGAGSYGAAAERAGAEGTGVQGAGAERAEEPCPCGKEPSVRQAVARTPRAVGAARAGAVVTGAPVVDRGGTDIRAAGTGKRPGTVASAPNTVELQTFRC